MFIYTVSFYFALQQTEVVIEISGFSNSKFYIVILN